jgi:hypothetical protein
MRRRLAIPALVALLAVGWGTASEAAKVQSGNVIVTFNADFAPHSLPRHQPAPVKIEIDGDIATSDGSHPPPLKWLEVEVNRAGRIYSRGLPVCSAPLLQSTSTEQALERCRSALVGRGRFRADVKLGDEVAASGGVLAFNSRRAGKQALLLHFFASVPVRFTLVVPLTISRRSEGNFGTVLRAKIPKLGGGLGSVTELHLTIGRRYSYGSKRRSYVSAACAAPPGFTTVPFPFVRGSFRFEGHHEVSEILTKSCHVR